MKRRQAKGLEAERSAGSGPVRVLIVLGLFVLLFLGGRIFFAYETSAMRPGSRSVVRVAVPKGAQANQISKLLVSKGLARNASFVDIAVGMSGVGNHLKAGTYALTKSMSVDDMIAVISAGKTDTVEVTIPEGFTTAQIADRLASKKLVDIMDFIREATTGGETYTFADGFATPRNLEGYLYPLTYTIVKGSSARSIVKQMLDEFDSHIVSGHPEVHDWQEYVIVASMVEREAKIDSDRPLIASVYYNRLRRGMPLQCDATVQYALPAHKARLLYSDLRVDSPYNTYLHKGLPPGPICNPGQKSIEAALYPANTDYLFYVAGPTGAHIFSRTLADQDRIISQIRRGT
jgi:UPF0755 protein